MACGAKPRCSMAAIVSLPMALAGPGGGAPASKKTGIAYDACLCTRRAGGRSVRKRDRRLRAYLQGTAECRRGQRYDRLLAAHVQQHEELVGQRRRDQNV